MNQVVIKSLYVILVSLGIALIFNYLFFYKLIGISVSIFTMILLTVVFLSKFRRDIKLGKNWWIVLLIAFFSLMPAIRDNEFILFLDVCATLGLLMLLAHQITGTPVYLMRIWDYIKLVILGSLRMLGSALSTVANIATVHSNVEHRDTWIRVIKGVIVALPVLVVFVILFSQADMAFSGFVKGFVDISISERTFQYLFLFLVAFVSALSFLSYIFFSPMREIIKSEETFSTAVQSGRGLEVLVFLGLISTLFLVFIGFQVTYLFGGETNIVNAGFTYAEYARHGFWELLAVSVLSLLVLLASEKYAVIESRIDRRFMIPAIILVAEVVVIIFSAFKRLSLYIDTYGMTMLRFYVAGFIILLLVLFILLAIKFIKSKREEFFAFSTLLSVAGFLVVVNLLNPDAFIIRSNIEQLNKTGKVDVLYTEDLSADAVAGKLELYEMLEGEEKATLLDLIQKQKVRLESNNDHWQSANLSRSRALKLLSNF